MNKYFEYLDLKKQVAQEFHEQLYQFILHSLALADAKLREINHSIHESFLSGMQQLDAVTDVEYNPAEEDDSVLIVHGVVYGYDDAEDKGTINVRRADFDLWLSDKQAWEKSYNTFLDVRIKSLIESLLPNEKRRLDDQQKRIVSLENYVNKQPEQNEQTGV